MKKAWAILWESNSCTGYVTVNRPDYRCGWAHNTITEIEIEDDAVADVNGVYDSSIDWYEDEEDDDEE